ncbi:HAMP domain-containing histidine kinase [Candidatus Woesearchaeota archaeon]|nr:HAMP domain-containing histidine kinase [Candidatus Woesearchaeota archaeon]
MSVKNALILHEKFLNVCSHDFLNCITPMLSTTEMLKKKKFGKHQKRMINLIQGSVQTLHELINIFFDAERMTHGLTVLKLSRVQVDNVASAAIHDAKAFSNQKKVHLKKSVPKRLFLIADETYLAKALSYAVNSAIMMAPQNGTVHVRAYRSGEYVALSVSSARMGTMKPSFNLEPGTLKRCRDASLYVAKNIIKLHGGKVKTAKGQTTFFLRA